MIPQGERVGLIKLPHKWNTLYHWECYLKVGTSASELSWKQSPKATIPLLSIVVAPKSFQDFPQKFSLILPQMEGLSTIFYPISMQCFYI